MLELRWKVGLNYIHLSFFSTDKTDLFCFTQKNGFRFPPNVFFVIVSIVVIIFIVFVFVVIFVVISSLLSFSCSCLHCCFIRRFVVFLLWSSLLSSPLLYLLLLSSLWLSKHFISVSSSALEWRVARGSSGLSCALLCPSPAGLWEGGAASSGLPCTTRCTKSKCYLYQVQYQIQVLLPPRLLHIPCWCCCEIGRGPGWGARACQRWPTTQFQLTPLLVLWSLQAFTSSQIRTNLLIVSLQKGRCRSVEEE